MEMSHVATWVLFPASQFRAAWSALSHSRTSPRKKKQRFFADEPACSTRCVCAVSVQLHDELPQSLRVTSNERGTGDLSLHWRGCTLARRRSLLAERLNSDKITKMLRREARAKQNDTQHVEVLLLGTGNAGKSTIFKQMELAHSVKYEDPSVRS